MGFFLLLSSLFFLSLFPLLFLCLLLSLFYHTPPPLYVSSCISQLNSNSVGVSLGTTIFLTFFLDFLTHLINQIKAAFYQKYYQLASQCYNCTLNLKLICKTDYFNTASCNPSEVKIQMMYSTFGLAFCTHRLHK